MILYVGCIRRKSVVSLKLKTTSDEGIIKMAQSVKPYEE